MPQNFVVIHSTSYKVLTQPMQLNVTVMETETHFKKISVYVITNAK
jgi:hypothetical protein